MKYLLVVGFTCDIYRQEPRARIFIGDKLIDEFYIPNYKDTLDAAMKEFWQNKHILQPLSEIEWANIQIKNFPSLRFYEVELNTTPNKMKLCIEIKNSDNNYTNGFTTNSTLIQLKVCSFFPLHEKLLSRLKKIKNKNRSTQNYAWYHLGKNRIFDLILNSLSWQRKNGKIIESIDIGSLNLYNVGGDGVFTCELVKKYQILISKTKKSYRYNFNSFFIDYFINKYKQHANQRNTD
jgi:hypothetical protein